MKISLLGNIVDLEQIYEITELRKPNTYRFNDSEFSGDNPDDWMWSFKVHFFNEKTKRILHDNKESIEKVRNELVDLWSNNQKDIIKIDFK